MTTDVALAAVAPSQQSLNTLQVHLGNQDGGLVFEPDTLTFEAGKRYKLLLDNPSPVKHYFTAKDFTDVIWTQKVEAGQVEVKGAIHELELKPGAEAEWVLIPQKPGTYELHCSIVGHAEAGMVGQLTVTAGV
ncbi:MAG: cupredoxin domain-containing protein [Cyanobacteria bacterium P01_A01_bin.137]